MRGDQPVSAAAADTVSVGVIDLNLTASVSMLAARAEGAQLAPHGGAGAPCQQPGGGCATHGKRLRAGSATSRMRRRTRRYGADVPSRPYASSRRTTSSRWGVETSR